MDVVLIILVGGVAWVAASLWANRSVARLLKQARSILGSDTPVENLEAALRRLHDRIEGQSLNKTRSRAELDAVLESVVAPIVAIDLQEEVLFCNSSFAEEFNATNAISSRLASVVREVDVLAAFRWTLQHGDVQATDVEMTVREQTRFYSLHVQPLRVEREMVGAVGVFLDVTEARRTEKMRTDFVANVSHELRTPLTSIKGFAEALPAQTPGVEAIRRNADRMLSLVHDLMDLAHLEDGGRLKQASVDPNAIVNLAIQQLTHRFPSIHKRVVTQIEGTQFWGDNKLLEQVVINLLENALLYSGPEGPIEIDWGVTSGVQSLRVRDHGPGISPAHLPRVFERFYRIDPDRGRDRGGTGLGLAIVKHVMQRHGGKVRVESRLGEGAEFICEWPYAEHSPHETPRSPAQN